MKKLINLQTVETPIIKKPGIQTYNYSKKKKVNENIVSDDWETMRNFKTTATLDKNMELRSTDGSTRSYLNKLTNENYSEISNEIKLIIKDIVEQNEKLFIKNWRYF